jgi:hypothetical protein
MSNKPIMVLPKVLLFWRLISLPCELERLGQQRYTDTAVSMCRAVYGEDKDRAQKPIPRPGKIYKTTKWKSQLGLNKAKSNLC